MLRSLLCSYLLGRLKGCLAGFSYEHALGTEIRRPLGRSSDLRTRTTASPATLGQGHTQRFNLTIVGEVPRSMAGVLAEASIIWSTRIPCYFGMFSTSIFACESCAIPLALI
ncbi:hypothetical protein C8Q78DRAFT_457078 [Trametes maxima]|nr:hypothetical protein C8Q78DRAFT_457078 [Trametes maxima]